MENTEEFQTILFILSSELYRWLSKNDQKHNFLPERLHLCVVDCSNMASTRDGLSVTRDVDDKGGTLLTHTRIYIHPITPFPLEKGGPWFSFRLESVNVSMAHTFQLINSFFSKFVHLVQS